MRRRVTRRHALASIGGGSVLLAGCLGDDDGDSGDDGDDGDSDDSDDSGDSGDDGGDEPVEGGELHVTQSLTRAEEFDPVMSNGAYSNQVWEHIYDRLYDWNDEFQLEPKVAVDDPVIERDDTRFIIEIQDGIEFHNGDELTASDVVYSFLAPIEEETDNMTHHAMIDTAEVIDDYQLQVDLSYPSGFFASDSIGVAIVPEEVREEDREAFIENPVGSGPFEWSDFEYNEYVELTSVDDYWDDPQPLLDSVRYEAVQDAATRVASIRSGDTDIIMAPQDNDWPVLDDEENVNVHRISSYGFHFMGFHCREGSTAASAEVRRGVGHAISVPDWVETQLPNLGEIYTDPFGESINTAWDFPGDEWAEAYPDYDPDQAEELLNEHAPDDWSPTIITTPDTRADFAEMVALRLGEIGYETEVQRLDLLPLIERVNEGDPDEYDMWMFGYAGGSDPDEYIYNLFHESLQGNSISTFYDGSENFQDWIIEARESVDRDERRDLYINIVDEVLENLPLMPAFDTMHAAASMDRVQDFNLSPNVYINPRLSSEYGNIWLDE